MKASSIDPREYKIPQALKQHFLQTPLFISAYMGVCASVDMSIFPASFARTKCIKAIVTQEQNNEVDLPIIYYLVFRP